jgi:hypothetical protein
VATWCRTALAEASGRLHMDRLDEARKVAETARKSGVAAARLH